MPKTSPSKNKEKAQNLSEAKIDHKAYFFFPLISKIDFFFLKFKVI
jgi:hypothetical protein